MQIKSHSFFHTNLALSHNETLICIRQALLPQESLVLDWYSYDDNITCQADERRHLENPEVPSQVCWDLWPTHVVYVAPCWGEEGSYQSKFCLWPANWSFAFLRAEKCSFSSLLQSLVPTHRTGVGLRPIASVWDARTLPGYFVMLKLLQKVIGLCKEEKRDS